MKSETPNATKIPIVYVRSDVLKAGIRNRRRSMTGSEEVSCRHTKARPIAVPAAIQTAGGHPCAPTAASLRP
jgi:hypothetical protein